ncbi:hypothetical protein B0H13DRAFT_2374860 [Mycena leptocephala]|nr:hypothetical protein B0H13DRAFT_2374860 [Mycena leptocephala]
MRLVSKIFSSLSLTQAVPTVFCAMLDDSQLVKHFPTLLKALKARIKALPASLPLTSLEALITRYLGDLEIDAEEGAWYSASRERILQVSKDEQCKQITLGKYGMNLVCPFLEFYYTVTDASILFFINYCSSTLILWYNAFESPVHN